MIVELGNNRPAELTGIRYHELALQRWLYANFHVKEGYPVPLVIATPMDAFGHFANLWASQANNPFKYLLDAKDDDGTPLYEPDPSPPRYPLFSAYRKGWEFRAEQNYSFHRWRNLSWTTDDKAEGIGREHLGTATTAKMPMAWNFKFQLDFFCLRPDTLALFVHHLMRKLYRGGGNPQTWVMVAYPFYGRMLCRMTLDGPIGYVTPEQPNQGEHVEFRTSVNLTIEGWEPDINIKEVPTFWYQVLNATTPSVATPEELDTIYALTTDLRNPDLPDTNPNINLRVNTYNPNVSVIPGYTA